MLNKWCDIKDKKYTEINFNFFDKWLKMAGSGDNLLVMKFMKKQKIMIGLCS